MSCLGTRWYHVVPLLAVVLDALTTGVGLWLGLVEQGAVASRLLPSLGPAY